MGAQIVPKIIYVAILLAALLAPYAMRGFKSAYPRVWAIWTITAIALFLTAGRQGSMLPFSLVLLLPFVRSGWQSLLGAAVALLLFAPVVWWPLAAPITATAAGLFAVLGVCAAFLPQMDSTPTSADADSLLLPTMGLCLAAGLIVGTMTAPFGASEPIYLAWHHWGAYLAPVDAWLAGGLPYRDFPVQYGMGPTALLAATCGNDCWRGIYNTAIACNALYFAALAGCVILLTAGRSRGLRWLSLLALFCATFVWTAFPLNLGSAAMTPSVAGLRFLLVALLLLHILRAEQSSQRRDWIGHSIWVCSLAWSPEAALFGTLVWWPYMALRNAERTSSWREALLALVRGAARGVMALAIGLAGLGMALWLLSGQALRLSDFMAYILHPPGPLPANPLGTAWMAIAASLMAISVLVDLGPGRDGRRLYACLLGLLAAGSYFLSRSHDNNILNLFPLLVLVLTAMHRTARTDQMGIGRFDSAFLTTTLAAMVAFVTTVNITPWIEGAARVGLFRTGPAHLIARFTPHINDAPGMLPRDAVAALTALRAHDAGAVVLLDDRKLIPWSRPGTSWTPVSNVANFEPLPSALIAHYICRGAAVYRRSGWLVVDERRYGAWLEMFRTAYDVRVTRRFGRYGAYYLVPRTTNPACGHG